MLELNNETFEEAIKGKAVVQFSAAWCGPCKQMYPTMDKLTATLEGTGVTVGKVDVDECNDLAVRYVIRSVPTIILFENGQVSKKIVGTRSESQLITEFDLARAEKPSDEQ